MDDSQASPEAAAEQESGDGLFQATPDPEQEHESLLPGPAPHDLASPSGTGPRELPLADLTRLESRFREAIEALPVAFGQTVAITGCTTGTGFVLAQVAARQQARVLCLNRPSERAVAAVEQLRQSGADATHIDCDLSSFESVRAAAVQVTELAGEDGLHVLCCNAGVMHFPDVVTKDGYDIQMQTNQLSHFLLTKRLWTALTQAAKLSGEARVVVHGSQARILDGTAGMCTIPCCCGAALKEPHFEKHEDGGLGGDGWCDKCCMPLNFSGGTQTRYQQSKLANLVFVQALHERIIAAGSKVKAVHAHPGVAKTRLASSGPVEHGYFPSCFLAMVECTLMQSAQMGALGIVRGCFASDAASGEGYGPQSYSCCSPHCTCGPLYQYVPWVCCICSAWGPAVNMTIEPWAKDKHEMALLWTKCEAAVGEAFVVS